MHYAVYFVLALTPIALFPLLALPVENHQPAHRAALIIVYITNLIIPFLHAGEYSVPVNTISGCFAFASSLKMAVWLFCMPLEERRKRPYYIDFWHWRGREPQHKSTTAAEAATPAPKGDKSSLVADMSIPQLIKKYLMTQLCFELLELTLTVMDQKKSIRVFWYMVHRVMGQQTEDHFTFRAIAMSFLVWTLNAAYLQIMMQTTYNACMIVFCVIHHLIPGHAGYQKYVEELLAMPPMFDSPWKATSLRDYWSNRWHQFYNTCFYRLAFKPVRRICDKIPLLRPFRRALPTLAVFALSASRHTHRR
ncbi:hypothetical protein BX666DRAFT_658842 [Dichotomocladium elegans]|nr:hypothetical protein BX666DRAFT_658842 [Dichotomocladium elegans]